ncbi:MAG: NUDIX hydrolase [Dehalococcoidales bacterium]|jgi:ADP-ribose pyrophosphatase|nr:ADP-ribose pyrophosphatase [Dehalococcoidales bacterium]MDP6042969.1 NUDIX hydrolase [Dehalococcoidales bacterium]MDP6449107.1 NUDIX hydrolase [Dehalococcoidales bacterium]MDP6577112.1 NUDIX hydrolase [Dehalococcoidales bacterium]MDP6824659.1 NUDIX hydrolase [Dehalococcoidales bacterium]
MEKTLSSQLIFNGRVVKMRIDTVQTPGGRQTTREIVEHADCVAIIAIDDEDNVLLVRQFRKPVEKELLEIPAGGINPGERPETAVRREMREETGYLPRKVSKLGGFYSAPGYCSEYLYLYLATDLISSQLHAEDTAEIRLVRLPTNQILNTITLGGICDAKSIAGLLTYLSSRKEPPKTA